MFYTVGLSHKRVKLVQSVVLDLTVLFEHSLQQNTDRVRNLGTKVL